MQIKLNRDNLAIVVPIAVIIVLGIAMANIDRIFPAPSAAGKVADIMRMVSFNSSDELPGTNPNASVTVVEFSDFQCPACAMAAGEVHKVLSYYGDRINFVYRHFPIHDGSAKAAEASECARDQGKFWEYHDVLFANSNSVSISDLNSYARGIGLDAERFSLCLSSGEKSAKVQADSREGYSYKISGTPTFIINGMMLAGAQPFEKFREIIDGELENAE